MPKIKILVNVGLICISVAAFLWIDNLFFRDNFSVRVTDNSGCKLERYEISLPEKTVVVNEEQVVKGTIGALGKIDTLIHVYGREDKDGKISYVLRASYSDCDDIVGERRVVKKGYLLYEYIKDGKVQFQVRST